MSEIGSKTFRQIAELYHVQRDEKGARIPYPDPWLSEDEREKQAAVNFMIREGMEKEAAERLVYRDR